MHWRGQDANADDEVAKNLNKFEYKLLAERIVLSPQLVRSTFWKAHRVPLGHTMLNELACDISDISLEIRNLKLNGFLLSEIREFWTCSFSSTGIGIFIIPMNFNRMNTGEQN